ncbi:cupin domain-containing protein [Fredinandcohnia quinoae]|uniref:Cupin domain-containing protein n=1 Tax=Fredinandcohnia quinoae TaxID=2918902 RepID=A0AAW5DW07_9BACI|nr:cupin domain-containing protein [Fredinandcohnia sp. SECRCQ15]MCH1624533.1 cupin domain-containing protein [Fredinandcohnia sp. SECRCQ15]
MYNDPYGYPYPYYANAPIYQDGRQYYYWVNPYEAAHFGYYQSDWGRNKIISKDHGPNPFVVDINEAAEHNKTFRTAIWTGQHLQVTLMSLNPGEDIGLEIHPSTDQFLRIEEGHGIVRMGRRKNHLTFERKLSDDSAIMVPAGTWHNVINTGRTPLKLYSIYAPPHHPRGTVQVTKAEAQAAESTHGR